MLKGVAVLACASSLGLRAQQQLSLHDAVAEALSSPQARIAAAQIEEAKGYARQAGLGLNPRLFLQSEDFRPWSNNFSFTTQTEDYGYLSQTFELDGKRHKRVAVANARLEQVRANAQLAHAQIAARVAGAYWNAQVLSQVVNLLQQDMKAVDDMVRYHQERVDAGAMRGVDLLRIQIERDRLQMALLAAERDATQARLELFKQMGRAPVAEVTLSDSIDSVTPVPPVPLATVLEKRPDVVAARDAIAAAEADVKLQHANAVPDLDLLGGYKRNGAANTGINAATTGNGAATTANGAENTGFGGLQIPLPFRNRNQGEIERANASVNLARANLATLDIQVQAEVAQGEEIYKQEREMIETLLPDMRQKAKQNLDLMTEAYRIGGVDLLRYLDAERTEFDVEVNALRSLAEYQQAALRLQLSYGVIP